MVEEKRFEEGLRQLVIERLTYEFDGKAPGEQEIERKFKELQKTLRGPTMPDTPAGAWEVRDNHAEQLKGAPVRMVVQRSLANGAGVETAASGITDYGVACVLEAALNLRDGTVE